LRILRIFMNMSEVDINMNYLLFNLKLNYINMNYLLFNLKDLSIEVIMKTFNSF